ncbi:Hsp20/alpha crystallin family protein [Cupriavidus gilardii]|uniref:Hsp20/alpha crystallin family protein n=1 Tax=Cupriavidus gilardii TaxID=82541 RepID=UPI001EE61693|nr:Hsp20/alpha crystallin family protein [Cupriavidus gilardii]MCG5259471.1 Hsp20/alpha crystallin family protein [Cupriavidus gilardii]MDF9429631.1 Hsp20/alpha crystallin family protein [Cupriavidus gilardii]
MNDQAVTRTDQDRNVNANVSGHGDSSKSTDNRNNGNATLLPRVDVSEDPTGITLLADLPGVSRDTLHVRADRDRLTIEGEIRQEMPEGLEPVYAEVQIARYKRVFTLSRELDSSAISAVLKDGVLNLRIPKQAEAQPRRIEVKVG